MQFVTFYLLNDDIFMTGHICDSDTPRPGVVQMEQI